jgi:hypothetical protein
MAVELFFGEAFFSLSKKSGNVQPDPEFFTEGHAQI